MSWIRFGQFELNIETYELRKGGVQAKIQQQPTRVLALLVRNAGKLTTRGQIRETIWGSETYVDFEHGLNFCIRQIRMALSDNADNPAFVETLPRLGYRFIAPLDRSDEYTGSMSKARRRIGVLPIEDLGKAVEDYFALGRTEDLISALSRVDSEKLRVVTGPRFRRDSAIEADLEQFQRDLNLDYLLRGWVLHDLHDKSVFGRRYMTALPLIYPYCRRRSHGESVNRLPSNCCLRPPLVRGNTLARQQSTICTPKYFRGCTLDSGVVSG